MPVTWELLGEVLVLRYLGNPSTAERQHAVDEALADPAFRPGSFLLFDTRSGIGTVSAEELARRVEWAVGLTSRNVRPRFAVVAEAGRTGIAEAGIRMVGGRVEIGTFSSMDEALAWLTRPGPAA